MYEVTVRGTMICRHDICTFVCPENKIVMEDITSILCTVPYSRRYCHLHTDYWKEYRNFR